MGIYIYNIHSNICRKAHFYSSSLLHCEIFLTVSVSVLLSTSRLQINLHINKLLWMQTMLIINRKIISNFLFSLCFYWSLTYKSCFLQHINVKYFAFIMILYIMDHLPAQVVFPTVHLVERNFGNIRWG